MKKWNSKTQRLFNLAADGSVPPSNVVKHVIEVSQPTEPVTSIEPDENDILDANHDDIPLPYIYDDYGMIVRGQESQAIESDEAYAQDKAVIEREYIRGRLQSS